MMEIREILARLERVLGGEELAELEVELRAFRSRGERHWIEDFLAAAEALPLPEVPPVLSRDLRSLIEGPKQLESHVAELVRDSRSDRALTGVRGGDSGGGWSLTYTSEVADLVIDAWPQTSGDIVVEGQLMPHGHLAGAVRAKTLGPPPTVVGGDELGRFRFEGLTPTRHELVVDDGLIELTAELELGADR